MACDTDYAALNLKPGQSADRLSIALSKMKPKPTQPRLAEVIDMEQARLWLWRKRRGYAQQRLLKAASKLDW